MEVWLISPTAQRPFRVVDFHSAVVKPKVDQGYHDCLKSYQSSRRWYSETPQSQRRHDPANHVRVGQELFMPAAQHTMHRMTARSGSAVNMVSAKSLAS